jgi:hypothetical protein
MKKALPIVVTLLGFTGLSWSQSPSAASSGAAAAEDKSIRPYVRENQI